MAVVLERGIVSLTSAAELLGVDQHTVADVARAWGIDRKQLSHGRAFGLNEQDLILIGRALNRSEAVVTALLSR